jgi:hypothetical protein
MERAAGTPQTGARFEPKAGLHDMEKKKYAPCRKECGTHDLDGEMTEIFWIMAPSLLLRKKTSRSSYK